MEVLFIFVSCEEAVNAVVSQGIVIPKLMHIVEPLVTPSLKLKGATTCCFLQTSGFYLSIGKIICFKCQGWGHIASQCPKVPIGTHVKFTNTILKSINAVN